MDRAYALLHVKAFDAEQRRFSGYATTPELDRQGHIVESSGVRFHNPVPLLFHHDRKQIIGSAVLGAADGDGNLSYAKITRPSGNATADDEYGCSTAATT
jgi:hypothetical protein